MPGRAHTVLVVGLLTLCCIAASTGDTAVPAIDEIIANNGFAHERHSVTTADGETLNMVRIPRSEDPFRGVVYLQHGLFDTSNTWLLNDKDDSLAFLLSLSFYDVWIGNSRGNNYSPAKNYAFSWDESAQYDLPATLAYIKKVTGQAPVYIGHSQGTAMMFAALSRGWVKGTDDIKAFIALGPIAYLKHESSPLFGAMGTLHADTMLRAMGAAPFTLTTDFARKFIKDKRLRYSLLSCLFGESKNLGDSNWHGFFPMTTSAQNVAHWAQQSRTGDLQEYNGSLNPFSKYQQYHLSDIPKGSVKTYLYFGTNDLLASNEDATELINDLTVTKNLVTAKKIDGYAHMDFTWARNAKSAVYPQVMEVLKSLYQTDMETVVV